MSKVQFFSADAKLTLRRRNLLKAFIEKLFRNEKTKLSSLNYIFCSDEYLLNINKQFLLHDYFTDIITFNLGSKGEPLMGEIYISLERVKENAINYAVSFEKELYRVIFHGALHLCGYKDKTKREISKMRSAEEKYLSLYLIHK